MANKIKRLAVLLGDQLQGNHPALLGASKDDTVVLMAEVASAATRVPYHKKKLVFLFSAMRHRAEALKKAGWSVDYVALDDPENTGSLGGELKRALKRFDPDEVVAQEPSSHAAEAVLKRALGARLDLRADNRFLSSRADFADWAEGRKQLVMEHFYRDMRRQTGVLMEGDDPAGGKWNFDSENRKPPKEGLDFPEPPRFEPDETTTAVRDLVEEKFPDQMGDADGFAFAVTGAQAETALDHFIENRLASFGDYQDAMLKGDAFLSHSLLGLYLNTGLLDPLE
ncbi:MAG: cryptochrome/photolyase family protein, partial [Alphaproteobacteria bacterium]|nr:cryptochrome/photolyase family protein [Alphaproteobacteria bacterium]